ncbi:MAG TPA: hypothetical protein PK957_01840 [Candidatus Dojkabacteria bacterium]|nr:hypothetical protein [Candidatus Dojkabacteria bacterium]HQF36032.1 hypothetical protein [Candidatus Dojkabacteria bacterium]
MESINVGCIDVFQDLNSYSISFTRIKKPRELKLRSTQHLYHLKIGKLDNQPRNPIWEACLARCLTAYFLLNKKHASVLWIPDVISYRIPEEGTISYINQVESFSGLGVALRIVDVEYGSGVEKALEMTGFVSKGRDGSLCSYLSFPGTKDLIHSTHYSPDY